MGVLSPVSNPVPLFFGLLLHIVSPPRRTRAHRVYKKYQCPSELNSFEVIICFFPKLISVVFCPHKDQETWDTEDPTSVSHMTGPGQREQTCEIISFSYSQITLGKDKDSRFHHASQGALMVLKPQI